MDKVDELFYILKADEDGEQFFYDKDLNKDYGFDYEHWSGKAEMIAVGSAVTCLQKMR